MRAQGLTKVRVTQPGESLSYMSIYLGRAKDFFKEAGIDLQVVITRGDGPDVQALMAKEVEFVATPPHHLYTLYLQNRKLLGICRHSRSLQQQHRDLQGGGRRARRVGGLAVRAEARGAQRLDDSASRRRARSPTTSGLYYILRAGLKPQVDAKVVGTGTGTAALAAMSNKISNASIFPSPTADEAVHRGFAQWLINNTRGQDPDLKDFLHAVIYVRPDFLSDNTDLCKRMVGAIVKSAHLDQVESGRRSRQGDAAVLLRRSTRRSI